MSYKDRPVSVVIRAAWLCRDCDWEGMKRPTYGMCPNCEAEVISWREFSARELEKLAAWTAAAKGMT